MIQCTRGYHTRVKPFKTFYWAAFLSGPTLTIAQAAQSSLLYLLCLSTQQPTVSTIHFTLNIPESLQLSCILKLFQFLFLLGLRLQSYMGFKLSAPTQFFPKPVFVCNQGEVFQECK